MLFVSLAGCTGGDEAPGQDASGGTATPKKCTAAEAKATRAVTVTDGKFDLPCASARAGKQLFVISGGSEKVTVATTGKSPDKFTVDLPQKTSTYPWKPKKRGT